MKSPVLYIIESLICSGLFLIVYQLMIDRATSYLIRRRFLILSVAVSCMIPLLQIPIATNNLPKSIQTTMEPSTRKPNIREVMLCSILAAQYICSVYLQWQPLRFHNYIG